jgi:hypothetical protein
MTRLRPLATAQQVTQTKDPATLHPGSCTLYLCALASASGSLCFGRDRSFLSHSKGSRRTFGVYPKTHPRGIAIGDGARHWTLCHDAAALLHAGLGGPSNSPWPNDSLLAPGPHCKHARHAPLEEKHPPAEGDGEPRVFNPSFSNGCAMRS